MLIGRSLKTITTSQRKTGKLQSNITTLKNLAKGNETLKSLKVISTPPSKTAKASNTLPITNVISVTPKLISKSNQSQPVVGLYFWRSSFNQNRC